MMKHPDWRPHFPLPSPRAEQSRALDWLCEQIVAGQRRLILEAGTGVGKSAIAVAFGSWLEEFEHGQGQWNPGATVLTSQKSLQDQYTRDFQQARDLRAAANFKCSGPVGGTCGETSRVRKAVGMELAQQSLRCSSCPYRVSKDDFIASRLGVTNYSYHLSEGMYAGEIPPRRLLVCDEAHNVEDEVRRWTSVEVTEADADELGLQLPTTEDQAAVDWLGDVYRVALQEKIAKIGHRLTGLVKKNRMGEAAVRRLANDNDKIDKRICQVNRLLNKGGMLLISRQEDRRNGSWSIRFQPSEVAELAEELLYSRASAILLTSATILDASVYRSAVGLTGAPFLSIPSPFRSMAFGVSFRPVGRMIQREIEVTLRDYPAAIRKILDENRDHKGIIHTMNYRITRSLQEALSGHRRLLFQGSSVDRERILREHTTSSEPTVIVSPSMMEGLDLRDDLGRFQVICKVPYPDMSDPIVGHKDREWYSWRTVRTLVQAVGRSVRSESDWSRTYILDTSYLDLMERASHMLPEHLRKDILVEEPL